jgi:hypothetical protein
MIVSFEGMIEINYVTKATSELLAMCTIPLSEYRLIIIVFVYICYHLISNLWFTVTTEIKLNLMLF